MGTLAPERIPRIDASFPWDGTQSTGSYDVRNADHHATLYEFATGSIFEAKVQRRATDRMKPHIVVLHRAPQIAMPFAEGIDHHANWVSYVVTPAALSTVPSSAGTVVVLNDYTKASQSVKDLSAQFGRPDRIIARGEFELLTAAHLRRELDVEGALPDEVLPFRDKLIMGNAIAAAGIATPVLAETTSAADVSTFAATHGFPVVVKPRLGAASRDVIIIRSPDELTQLPDLSTEPYMAQHFCPDRLGHVDGVWTGTRLGPWRASLYVDSSCLSFATGGKILGSVEIDEPGLLTELERFTSAVCTTLSAGRPQVFHLEYFLGQTSSGGPKIQFLEIAARVGGTEIAYIWRDLHKYDLLSASLDLQMGRRPPAHRFPDDVFGGFLLIRPEVTPPCRILNAKLDLERDTQSTIFAQSIPATGSVIRKTIGYFGVGAVFRFQGGSSSMVERSIQQVCAGFTMDCIKV